jgi:hypothetical protein
MRLACGLERQSKMTPPALVAGGISINQLCIWCVFRS